MRAWHAQSGEGHAPRSRRDGSRLVGPSRANAISMVRRIDPQHTLERAAHPLLAVKATLAGDFGHRQVRVLDNQPGALDPQALDKPGGRYATLPGEHPLEIAGAHVAAPCQIL